LELRPVAFANLFISFCITRGTEETSGQMVLEVVISVISLWLLLLVIVVAMIEIAIIIVVISKNIFDGSSVRRKPRNLVRPFLVGVAWHDSEITLEGSDRFSGAAAARECGSSFLFFNGDSKIKFDPIFVEFGPNDLREEQFDVVVVAIRLGRTAVLLIVLTSEEGTAVSAAAKGIKSILVLAATEVDLEKTARTTTNAATAKSFEGFESQATVGEGIVVVEPVILTADDERNMRVLLGVVEVVNVGIVVVDTFADGNSLSVETTDCLLLAGAADVKAEFIQEDALVEEANDAECVPWMNVDVEDILSDRTISVNSNTSGTSDELDDEDELNCSHVAVGAGNK
jgi:hypothetical protein